MPALHPIETGLITGRTSSLQALDSGFISQAFAAVVEEGALALLSGETQGFAIDATLYDDVTPAAYAGGPVGGTVAVIDTGTPANNKSNVALDASNLVQSGTSPKMVHHLSSPYVRWSAHNLHYQSQTFNTGWAVGAGSITANDIAAPDGTATADRFNTTGDGIVYSPSQSLVSGGWVADRVYTASVYAKKGNVDFIRFIVADTDSFGNRVDSWFNINTGALGSTATTGTPPTLIDRTITSAGNGWYRCTITFSYAVDKSLGGISFNGAATDTAVGANGEQTYLWGAQINRGYTATPYLVTTSAARIGIPQSYDAAEAMYGILVEPAATNLALRSEDFATTWATDKAAITANNTTAPDGATTADKLTEDNTAASRHIVYQQVTDASLTRTFSAYLKANTRTAVALNTQSADGYYTAVFNLSNGTVGSTSGALTATNNIISVGNGWYRCSITVTSPTQTNPYHIIGLSDSTSPSFSATGEPVYSGDNASSAYVWGAQVENGSIATSYIPTLGSTVTRAVDVVTVPNSTYPWDDSVGTWVAWLKALDRSASHGYTEIVGIEGASGENHRFYIHGSATEGLNIQDNSTQQVDLVSDAINAGTAYKSAWAFASNDFAFVQDNGTPITDGALTLPTVTTTYFGGASLGLYAPFFVYQFRELPRRANNTELGTFTQ